MKRKVLILSAVTFTLLIFYMVYQIAAFTLFEAEGTLVKQIEVPSKKYSLRIYSLPSNATTYSSIQIRKYDDGVEEILQSYENQSNLESFSISQDTLTLVINDTMHPIRREEVKKIKLP